MPIVNIQITREGTLPGHTSVTREQKAQLIEGVSKLLLDVLNKPLNSTFVVIDEVDVENWGWGVFRSRNTESEWLPRPVSPIPSSWASRRNEHVACTASLWRLSFPPAQVRQFLKGNQWHIGLMIASKSFSTSSSLSFRRRWPDPARRRWLSRFLLQVDLAPYRPRR